MSRPDPIGFVGLDALAELDELEALAATDSAEARSFVDPTHTHAAAFIRDPARLKAVLATRRAGKTYNAGGLYLCETATKIPRSTLLAIGLTRESIFRIMWKDVLEEIDARHRIGLHLNRSELSITFPNKSVIYLLGVDSSEKEKRKAYGQKTPLAVIEEAALYVVNMRELVYSTLQPSTADYGGTICLLGMPSNLKRGLFYDLTKDADPMNPTVREVLDAEGGGRWSVHCWSALDNPYMRDKWAGEIAEKRAINPRIDETPIFQQEFLGRWTVDDSKLVYRYRQGRNDYDGRLPDYDSGEWHHTLGVDLGHTDACSFSVLAYHDHDPCSYVRESYKIAGLDVTDTANEIKKVCGRYQIDEIVIDGANKQAVEEMRRRHALPLQAADKTGKADFIEIMNGEFAAARIKVNPATCAQLVDEWNGLVWDDRTARREEDPRCPNHCADGALYAWRKLYAYLAQKPPPRAKVGTPEWAAEQEQAMERAALERATRSPEEDDAW